MPFVGLARVLVVLALLGAPLGCERDEPGEPPAPPERPMGSVLPPGLAKLLGDAQAPKDSAPSSSAIAALREGSLPIPPRDAPAQRIAFGKKRLAQLTDTELVIRSLPDGEVVTRIPVQDPRVVTELADGSLLAAGGSGLHHIAPDSVAASVYPRVPLLPGSLVFADRRKKEQFWVLHTLTSAVSLYELGEGQNAFFGMAEFFELEGVGQGAFTPLKDGSFLYGSRDRLRRVFPKGKKSEIELPSREGTLWRLALTRRIDQIWVARSSGRLELVQLARKALVAKTLTLPLELYDLASNDGHVALLRVERPDGKPRRFSLLAWDNEGRERLKVELPSDPAPGQGDDWVQAVTRDKTLTMASKQPFVAVGGPNRIAVWDLESGKKLF